MPVKRIVKKSKHFWKHGKHKGLLTIAINKNKEQRQRPKQPLYASIKDLMKGSKR